uniref:Uncharacterized protein n=1 Tax=Monopterus albus TaxID=43700 RepID=A0A3Q3K299_MONAL
MKKMISVLSVAVLLLLLPGTLTQTLFPLNITVKNAVTDAPPQSYITQVAYRGILLGAMKRLMNSNANFNFTYTEDPNYGPFLQSVNGVAGNNDDHTYWKLEVKTADCKIKVPDVGIGCYIPNELETIILKFTTW